MIIGALIESKPANKKLIASHPYYHDVLTWCVQERQQIPIWRNIFGFSDHPFLLVILFIMLNFTFTATTYVLQLFDDTKWDWTRLTITWICCSTGFVCGYKPNGISNRIFYAFCLLGSIVFSICHYSLVQQTLTKSLYNNQIKSTQEILNSSFELIGDELALEHLRDQDEVPKNIFTCDQSIFIMNIFYSL